MTIPCGKPINSEKKKLSLLYNEYVKINFLNLNKIISFRYIVYDESQVQLRYIVRVKFDSGNLL